MNLDWRAKSASHPSTHLRFIALSNLYTFEVYIQISKMLLHLRPTRANTRPILISKPGHAPGFVVSVGRNDQLPLNRRSRWMLAVVLRR